MSTSPDVIIAGQETFLQRVKGAFGTLFFLLIQHSPRLMGLYRNEKSWTLLRIALGCFGAALVILPIGLWHGYITALFGLCLFVVSILLPPAELESVTDRKARELGAQTVVGGGEYEPANAPAASVQLFISPLQTWAMDKNYEPLLSINTAEISDLLVMPFAGHWVLRVKWGDRKAEFHYKGLFAERFARLAAESLRHANLSSQPPADKRRAARA